MLGRPEICNSCGRALRRWALPNKGKSPDVTASIAAEVPTASWHANISYRRPFLRAPSRLLPPIVGSAYAWKRYNTASVVHNLADNVR